MSGPMIAVTPRSPRMLRIPSRVVIADWQSCVGEYTWEPSVGHESGPRVSAIAATANVPLRSAVPVAIVLLIACK